MQPSRDPAQAHGGFLPQAASHRNPGWVAFAAARQFPLRPAQPSQFLDDDSFGFGSAGFATLSAARFRASPARSMIQLRAELWQEKPGCQSFIYKNSSGGD
jgi:hypothetical protein